MFRKKVLGLVMVICLSVSCGVIVNAQALESLEPNEEVCELELVGGGNMVVTPNWAYTNDTLTALSISGSGVATGTAKITGYSGTTTKITITMYLEKKGFLGLFWSETASWTQTFNDYKGALSKSYNVSGGTYRIRAVYIAYKGTASETITAYSSEGKY